MLQDFVGVAAAGLVAAPIPILCALLAGLPARTFFLAILIPWIDYSLLTLGFVGLVFNGWGLGAGPLW